MAHSDFTKFNFGRGSATDPAGAYDAPPGPLVGWRGEYPSSFPTSSTPLLYRFRCLRRRGLVPLAQKNIHWRWVLNPISGSAPAPSWTRKTVADGHKSSSVKHLNQGVDFSRPVKKRNFTYPAYTWRPLLE